jgi:small neutral amino acid transporter SnatA (MarC family)
VFVSLLVAIDVVGLLPIYLGLTADLSPGERRPLARVGVMPLGVPMIAGPAVLTSLLTLGRTHGRLVTLAGFALNLLVVWVALRWAAALNRVLGPAGSQAVAKVSNLLLAAIGVTFIRLGVEAALTPSSPPAPRGTPRSSPGHGPA